MQNDHLGTPQQLLNPEGAVVHRQRMEAYGRSVRNGEEQSLRFAGQVEDAHSGTYYNFHRNYEARSGSYTQWDPIGLDLALEKRMQLTPPSKGKSKRTRIRL